MLFDVKEKVTSSGIVGMLSPSYLCVQGWESGGMGGGDVFGSGWVGWGVAGDYERFRLMFQTYFSFFVL